MWEAVSAKIGPSVDTDWKPSLKLSTTYRTHTKLSETTPVISLTNMSCTRWLVEMSDYCTLKACSLKNKGSASWLLGSTICYRRKYRSLQADSQKYFQKFCTHFSCRKYMKLPAVVITIGISALNILCYFRSEVVAWELV